MNQPQIIGGSLRNKKLRVPRSGTRPSSSRLREALFNILRGQVEDVLFLDLFAGSGAVGLEALSRGARLTTFVEYSPQAVACLKANIENLQVADRSEVYGREAFSAVSHLQRLEKTFDIIFADPPYGPAAADLLARIDRDPPLNAGGHFFLEGAAKDQQIDLVPLTRLQLVEKRIYGHGALWHFKLLSEETQIQEKS